MTKNTTSAELEEQIARLVAAATPIMDTSKLDRLERLTALVMARDTVNDIISAEVASMRSVGARRPEQNPGTWSWTSDRYSWVELGHALLMPKSTAQKKYADVAPRERFR